MSWVIIMKQVIMKIGVLIMVYNIKMALQLWERSSQM